MTLLNESIRNDFVLILIYEILENTKVMCNVRPCNVRPLKSGISSAPFFLALEFLFGCKMISGDSIILE